MKSCSWCWARGEVRAPVQEGGELRVVVLVADERVGPEDGLEPRARVAGLVADLGELLEVAGDLAFVPGDQDRYQAQRRGADWPCRSR
jgi:hypothetical protein